jgi:hypothetical protein
MAEKENQPSFYSCPCNRNLHASENPSQVSENTSILESGSDLHSGYVKRIAPKKQRLEHWRKPLPCRRRILRARQSVA